MVEWWNSIPDFEKNFWIVAFPSSAVFILQTVMTFFGIEHGGDNAGGGFHDVPNDSIDLSHDYSIDSGHEGSGEFLDVKFKLFTIRSIIVFFTVFSWSGIATTRLGMNHIVSIILAIILGFILMFIVSFVYYSAARLSEDGTMNIKNAIGKEGQIYLTIPKQEEGEGKIAIEFGGVLRVMDAVTYGEKIETGEKAIVIKVVDNQLLLVEKID